MSNDEIKYRFLFMPLLTTPGSPLTDSAMAVAWETVQNIAKQGHRVYLMLPRGMEQFTEMFSIPNVTVLFSGLENKYYLFYYAMADIQAVFDAVSPIGARYKVDGILCFSPAQALHLRAAVGTFESKYEIPIYVYELGLDYIDSNQFYGRNEEFHRNDMYGYSMAYPLMASRREISLLDDKARYYGLGASIRQAMVSRARIACPKLDLEMVESYQNRKRNERFTLLYAGRMNSVKKWENILQAYEALYRAGYDVQVDVLTNSPQMKVARPYAKHQFLKEAKHLYPISPASREVFYDHASRAHLFVMWSYSESYALALAEAVLLGCVPMIHKSSWAKIMFDEFTDDLFWFRNEKELKAKILWVKDHYEEALARAQPLADLYVYDTKHRGLSDVLLRYQQELGPASCTDADFRGFESAVVDMLKAWVAKVLATKKPLTVPLGRVVYSLREYTRTPIKTDDMARWASTPRVITDWNLYKLLKYRYRLRDMTEKAHVMFELNLETAHALSKALA